MTYSKKNNALFEPIAIVGRGCILPGAKNPQALWDMVASGQNLITTVPENHWQADLSFVNEQIASNRGGYVSGFDDVFDLTAYTTTLPEPIDKLDPIFHWLLYCAKNALDETGVNHNTTPKATDVIIGNLSYPTKGFSNYAEQTWLATLSSAASDTHPLPNAYNRFMSGYPAQLITRAFGLQGDAFCLDAACASSLYAIKIACDRLQDRRADLVITGGVNHADDLFLHIGFTALKALSQSGQSRPFHREADGLLPAEGAALVTLKRLTDAERDNNQIFGVIRGIGLSNDGRQRGFLMPDAIGQKRAMRSAYSCAGLDPNSISYVECHATGTASGDAVEVESMARFFSKNNDLPIGSMKSNLGHLITASGAASLLKVLGAMEAKTLPPTLHADDPIDAFKGSCLRPLRRAEQWHCNGIRRAAINNFGFGGNNAHLIVEEWTGTSPEVASFTHKVNTDKNNEDEIVICGVGIIAGDCPDTESYTRHILAGDNVNLSSTTNTIGFTKAELRFPPKDLESSLAQQTAVINVALQAISKVKPVDKERMGVFVGMGCDTEISRYGLRWRLSKKIDGLIPKGPAREEWLNKARDAIISPVTAENIVGTMPNIVANRINAQFDWRGQGFTLSSEETSGLTALEIAQRALVKGEIDAALVGAVDMASTTVHKQAVLACLPENSHNTGDAAVALVLKRAQDAYRDGDNVLASIVDNDSQDYPTIVSPPRKVSDSVGNTHAASGLLDVATIALALASRLYPSSKKHAAEPWLTQSSRTCVQVQSKASFHQSKSLSLLAAKTPLSPSPAAPIPPRLAVFSGPDRKTVLKNLESNVEGTDGPVKLAIVAKSGEWSSQRAKASKILQENDSIHSDGGIYFRQTPLAGELAFVFTGAAGSYPGMGRKLLTALPDIGNRLVERFPVLADVGWSNFTASNEKLSKPIEQLKTSIFLSQAHALVSRELLTLQPQAAIGLSSGETNCLFAFGAWHDMEDVLHEIEASGMYDTFLAGKFQTAAQAWGIDGDVAWRNWRVLAPIEEVKATISQEKYVRITIINTPTDCVIGGDKEGCRRVIEKIGTNKVIDLRHDMVVHCPELGPFQDAWHSIHDRETKPVNNIRFYANAFDGQHYNVDRSKVTAALLGQALKPIDFPQTINNAWNDGVRIFLEHGPRNVLSTAIKEILSEREHLALAMDIPGRDDVEHLFHIAAELAVAGVVIDLNSLRAKFPAPDSKSKKILQLSAHPPAINWPPLPQRQAHHPSLSDGHIMPEAPHLPPIKYLPPIANIAPKIDEPFTAASTEITEVNPNQANNYIAAQTAVMETKTDRSSPLPALALTEKSTAIPYSSSNGLTHSRTPEENTIPLQQAESDIQSTQLAESSAQKPIGPSFNRQQLETLASGKVSSIFGSIFEQQDNYRRQVRLPKPPLLLVDRVTGISGKAGSMGLGSIWTETDVEKDAWYMHSGRMPQGLLIEAGQADLLLISWLGADFLNRDKRVYRLLGCALTFHEGGLPKPGDTLRYDIHIDSHAKTGDTRLFFFHYQCRIGHRLMLSVRNGQAGFFTDQELIESKGILWDAAAEKPKENAILDKPPCYSQKRHFSQKEVQAWKNGDAYSCFGKGFEFAAAHQQTPNIPDGNMGLIERVVMFAPEGGPWKRGYLRAESNVPSDSWFYKGHFLNDPCMPGTLMADAAVQALSFLMAAMGFTIHRDGWRFEPVPSEEFNFVCRGQVVPDGNHLLTYEVFVEEIIDGDKPVVFASLLCLRDGFKVFHCPRFGVHLTPDWPLNTRRNLLVETGKPRIVSPTGDVRGDYAALLACAWGTPSDAFGSMYQRFDGTRKVPRLPGPPYHFVSRIISVDCPPGLQTTGGSLVSEYDVPTDAWYFDDNGTAVMPFSVLMEVLLQPCGWLASYMGFTLIGDSDMAFRNLDGDSAIQIKEVTPSSGTLKNHVTLTKFSKVPGMILVFFQVSCTQQGSKIMSMNTSFGFFDPTTLEKQVGLSVTEEERNRLAENNTHLVLADKPAVLFNDNAHLANGQLKMIDAITGFWPTAGKAALGRIHGTQTIRPEAWYFGAHFFQDPVQPGSLGLEALLQLLQSFMKLAELDKTIPNSRFEAIGVGEPLSWKYRGQVTPINKIVTSELEITEVDRQEQNVLVKAKGSLWADQLKIYEVDNLSMRVIGSSIPDGSEITLDLSTSPWLSDHRPTYTHPSLPMMFVVDLLASAIPNTNQPIIKISDVKLTRWITITDKPIHLYATAQQGEQPKKMTVKLAQSHGDEKKQVASGQIVLDAIYPKSPPALSTIDAPLIEEDLYDNGTLFHGPAFHIMKSLHQSSAGASYQLQTEANGVPKGTLHPGLLDALLHGIPHDSPELWFGKAASGYIAIPYLLETIQFYGPTPQNGLVRVEARPEKSQRKIGFIRFFLQAIVNDSVWLTLSMTEILLPKGPIGALSSKDRRAFLTQHFVEHASLSQQNGLQTILDIATVRNSNWLPGTLETTYGITGGCPEDLTRSIATKEHAAKHFGVHPSRIILDNDQARIENLSLNTIALNIKMSQTTCTVSSEDERLELSPVLDSWRLRLGVAKSPIEDIYCSLARRFIHRVHLTNPQSLADLKNKSCLFLANHQVSIESLLFSFLSAYFNNRPIVTIAKEEHNDTWMGRLIKLCEDYPGIELPRSVIFFNRSKQSSMLAIIKELKEIIRNEEISPMVHISGTRSTTCRTPVTQLSGVFLDLAFENNLPIIPIRFAGGLPTRGDERLEFPVDYGKQDIYIGRPILLEELSPRPLNEQKIFVLNALNNLGPNSSLEEPLPGQEDFAVSVDSLSKNFKLEKARSTVLAALQADLGIDKQFKEFIQHKLNTNDEPMTFNTSSEQQAWLNRLFAWLNEKEEP